LFSVRSCALPEGALLASYAGAGVYTDCYAVDVAGAVSLARYVTAFYTTPVFRLERLILRWAVALPSTDSQASRLAAGESDAFAAWQVEKRGDHQLLLADLRGRTRSWLMVVPLETANGAATRLYFGSAVLPAPGSVPGASTPGPGFRALLGFHRIYSEVLLLAAKSRLVD